MIQANLETETIPAPPAPPAPPPHRGRYVCLVRGCELAMCATRSGVVGLCRDHLWALTRGFGAEYKLAVAAVRAYDALAGTFAAEATSPRRDRTRICAVPGCLQKKHIRDLCHKHYQRAMRPGDTADQIEARRYAAEPKGGMTGL